MRREECGGVRVDDDRVTCVWALGRARLRMVLQAQERFPGSLHPLGRSAGVPGRMRVAAAVPVPGARA
eukprot:3935833-Rhodomonas_salina.3